MTDCPDNFKKIDLHVHTPESVCYSDRMANAGDIVQAALIAKLDAIAITDHNSVDGIDEVREAAKDTDLVILPGVELTTKNGHFLALFEETTQTSELNTFLDDVGLVTQGRGDAHTMIANEIETVLRNIREHGGITIAAHIDRWPSGFLETKDTRKRKQEIHENVYLDAIEITIPHYRQTWRNGQFRGYPMKRACVQGSDAHNPNEIGRRPVYINMDTIQLTEIKRALEHYETDILFPDDIDESP
ncbi:MAG: PHP domain-containing protein [Dehalococcoidales bacterium]|nr:MAG: PHP domain-containing protein [Dehalococcoidales bacterium]